MSILRFETTIVKKTRELTLNTSVGRITVQTAARAVVRVDGGRLFDEPVDAPFRARAGKPRTAPWRTVAKV